MKKKLNRRLGLLRAFIVALAFVAAAGCSKSTQQNGGGLPSHLSEVPSVRLNYRYEADVPAPTDTSKGAIVEEKNPSVQNDFDQNRPQELLDKTITSPDGKRILAVYHKPNDLSSEFRLDMYSADGKLLNKITSDLMAVHFPDTIRWSPDSANLALVAMLRGAQSEDDDLPNLSDTGDKTITDSSSISNSNVNADANLETSNTNTPPAATPTPPVGVLTFRTEQIYICNADGMATKPITQNEGLIYFYYAWSPDSSALAALAATAREWTYLSQLAESKGEIFVPVGRPRIVEKTGRERRLDDALTAVQPVWSLDSSKVACAFDTQLRIYDAGGNSPTQAAIPLKNNLLISSQAFDLEQADKLQVSNTQPDSAQNVKPSNAQVASTLPDEKTLVSFNPIVGLNWLSDDTLYFQTAFIKQMKNEADSVTSFPRWHRLILTPQAQTQAN
ncbi:MAG: hypothetical protein ACT4O9_08380 [Blastocatellia bacterium]